MDLTITLGNILTVAAALGSLLSAIAMMRTQLGHVNDQIRGVNERLTSGNRRFEAMADAINNIEKSGCSFGRSKYNSHEDYLKSHSTAIADLVPLRVQIAEIAVHVKYIKSAIEDAKKKHED